MDLKKLIDKLKDFLKIFPELGSWVLGLFPDKASLKKSFEIMLNFFRKGKVNRNAQDSDDVSETHYQSGRNHFEKFSSFLTALENRFLYRFPENKRRPMLFGVAGMVVLFLALVISIPVTHSGAGGQTTTSGAGFTIPSEELFFPSEPDFLPEFILEREPRSFWTIEDIRPYWRQPENTELWRDQIKSAVDRIMENVP